MKNLREPVFVFSNKYPELTENGNFNIKQHVIQRFSKFFIDTNSIHIKNENYSCIKRRWFRKKAGILEYVNQILCLLYIICFLDDCIFYLNVQVNFRYWSDPNYNMARLIHTQHPETLNMWAGFLGIQIVEPSFWKNTPHHWIFMFVKSFVAKWVSSWLRSTSGSVLGY